MDHQQRNQNKKNKWKVKGKYLQKTRCTNKPQHRGIFKAPSFAMATTLQRPFSNTVADCEADSLSFTDLVCIKDQNQPPPQKGHPLPLPPPPPLQLNPALPPTSLESLFGQTKSTFSSAPGSPNQLLPWKILSPQNGSPAASQPGPKVSWAPVRSSSSSSSNSSSRSNGNELGLNKAAKETNTKMRSRDGKDQKEGNHQSFSQKVFRSFSAPCRSCHALEPCRSVKVQVLQQESIKSH